MRAKIQKYSRKKVFWILSLATVLIGGYFIYLHISPVSYPDTTKIPAMERREACEISQFRIQIMSTKALAKSLLCYPLLYLEFDDSFYYPYESWLEPVTDHSVQRTIQQCVQELRTRKDAGKVLLELYRVMPVYTIGSEIPNVAELNTLDVLLGQKDFWGKLTADEQAEVEKLVDSKLAERKQLGLAPSKCYFYPNLFETP